MRIVASASSEIRSAVTAGSSTARPRSGSRRGSGAVSASAARDTAAIHGIVASNLRSQVPHGRRLAACASCSATRPARPSGRDRDRVLGDPLQGRPRLARDRSVLPLRVCASRAVAARPLRGTDGRAATVAAPQVGMARGRVLRRRPAALAPLDRGRRRRPGHRARQHAGRVRRPARLGALRASGRRTARWPRSRSRWSASS